MVYAGTVSRSFAEAADLMRHLAEAQASAKQVERLTRRIGEERVAERDAATAAFEALPLAEKFVAPREGAPPELAVVMVDGGRLQILDRAGAAAAAPDPPAAAPADEPEAWQEEKVAAGHWREDKVALLTVMHSEVSQADPCPEIPAAFVDATRIPELVRQLNKRVQAAADAAEFDAGGETESLEAETIYEPPRVERRRVSASRGRWQAFAPMVAAAAWALGFQGATRQAFVGDGSANNWKMRRRFFGSFTPILDFIHALSYVFAAATAGRGVAAGWACYRQWIGWVWQGRAPRVIAALQERQAELGLPEKDEPETSVRKVVARTLTYLHNHQDKMHYDEYRRQGLPITSSPMESTVKQIGRRVKGTEKFWSEAGAEAILQLRADQLSDDEPLAGFWQRRQATATGQRRYRHAG